MLPDAFRVLLLAQAGFTLGLILLIIAAYFHVWRRADNGRGLLPLHVVAVATAHGMLILFGVSEVNNRFGDGLTWRIPYLIAAMLVSDLALLVIMKLQVRRLRVADEPTDGHVEVTLRHDGEQETAVVVDDHEPVTHPLPDEPVPLPAAYVTLRTVRSLLVSVLGLLLIVGLISTAVAFQVTRTNRMIDEGAKVRAQLLEQVSDVEAVVCDLERRVNAELPPSVNCEEGS